MLADAEILAKGVSVSLTGGLAAVSLNRSPKSLWRTLGALRTPVCIEFTMVRVSVGTTLHRRSAECSNGVMASIVGALNEAEICLF